MCPLNGLKDLYIFSCFFSLSLFCEAVALPLAHSAASAAERRKRYSLNERKIIFLDGNSEKYVTTKRPTPARSP